MTLNLSKPSAGDVGWSAAINQNWTDIETQSNNQVTGPGSAIDNAVARFDGTTGKLAQNSAVTISDTLGQINWPTGGGAGTRILGPSDQNLAIAAESAGASSAGRAVSLTGGLGGSTSGAGGAASLVGGAAAGGNSAGGAASVTGGPGMGTGDGGAASLTGGAGGATGAGGTVAFTSGTGGSSSGASGAVTIGSGSTTDGATGAVSIKSSNATGTNRATGDLTLATGSATGTGANGLVITKVGDRIRRVQGRAITIPDAVSTTFCRISLNAGERVSGTVFLYTEVTDGTNFQAFATQQTFAAVDKAGTLTSAVGASTSTAFAASAGTLTGLGLQIADGTNEISLQYNFDPSLSSPTITLRWALEIAHSGNPTVTAS